MGRGRHKWGSFSCGIMTCPKCGNQYKVTQNELPMRDIDEYTCDCGRVLKRWNGGVTYGFERVKDPKQITGLFWIVPEAGGWVLLLFSDRDFSDHESLWREVASKRIIGHSNAQSDEFKELFDAFPRGRLETGEAIGKWMVGFGGDYPQGWNEAKLLERLKVARGDVEIEYDDHWKANDVNHQIAMKILGSDGTLK